MHTEILIIGGGPAGLQAALTVGRMHRNAVVVDSGEYRNATVSHMHNVAGFDGTPPAEFRAHVRAQMQEYPTIRFVEAQVDSVRRVDDELFDAQLSDSTTIRAQAVIVASGLQDTLPAVPGLAEAWGREAAQCPFCHGHEFADQPVALMVGEAAPHIGAFLDRVASELIVLDNGVPLSEEGLAGVEKLNARVVSGKVHSVERGDGLRIAVGEDSVQAAGIFVVPTFRQRSAVPEQLGLEMNDSGCIRIDALGHTSVPGVYAAGDAAHVPELPFPMPSVVQSIAAGQTAGASAIRERT